MKGQISASMMCADLLNMERDIRLMRSTMWNCCTAT